MLFPNCCDQEWKILVILLHYLSIIAGNLYFSEEKKGYYFLLLSFSLSK